FFSTAKNEARTEQGCFVSFCSALSKTWRPTGTPRRSIRCPTAGQPTPTSDSGKLDVLDRDCASCGRMMHICDHRYRHFYTLEGPVELVCKLNHCPNPDCPGHAKTKSPEMEATIALPAWAIGWDVFCWIGHRRFARHW